jgi:hypothetical protein
MMFKHTNPFIGRIHGYTHKLTPLAYPKPQKATPLPALFDELAQVNYSTDFAYKSAE